MNVLTSNESSFRGAKLVAFRAVSDLAGKASLFVITVVAARELSQEAFGLFALASTLGWMLAVAADFGIQLHLARSVARQPSAAAGILRRWLWVRLWTAALSIATVMAVLITSRAAWTSARAILLLTIVYACSGLIEFLHYFYRGLARSDIESSLTLWQRSAMLVSALAALWWRPDVTVLALAMLWPVVATLAVSLRIAARLAGAPLTMSPGTPAKAEAAAGAAGTAGIDVASASQFKRDVMPIGAGIVLSALYFRTDVFLIQLWSGTTAVALYSAVFRLVEALRLFPAAVLAVTLPALCRAPDRRPIVRVSVGVTLFGIAAAFAIWTTAPWLIPLIYGPDYATAVPAFRILAVSLPLLSLNHALTHQLIGWDGQRAYAAMCGAALVVNLALNSWLIPTLAIDGAAWATLGTEVFLTVGCVSALWMGGARPAWPHPALS
jgi:O-antigen/teichoic acid export membrane protein